MTTYAQGVGATSFSQTLTASSADTVTFLDRFGYVTVSNTSATGVIYATANGVPAVVAGANTIAVNPGQTVVIANGLPLWFPSSTVLRAGKVIYPDGGGTPQTNQTKNGQPGEVLPFQSSLQGQVANPGTSISIIGAAANTYTVAGTG